MKYFTKEWCRGDMTDEEADAVPIEYWQHIDYLLPLMPAGVRELATNTNIHDAEIEYAVYDPSLQELRLGLLCGGVVNSYFKLALVYSGVEVDTGNLAKICANPEREALYDESDILPDGRFQHSILFWPERIDLDITYRDLAISKQAIDGRIFTPRNPVFEVVGITEP